MSLRILDMQCANLAKVKPTKTYKMLNGICIEIGTRMNKRYYWGDMSQAERKIFLGVQKIISSAFRKRLQKERKEAYNESAV